MLSLNWRDAKIGDKYSGSGKEDDAGEKIKTLTFEVEGMMLEARELNALLSEPAAWHVLYNDRADLPEPYLRCFKALEIEKSIEGAYVALRFGIDQTELVFTECKLSKIRLVLCVGGLTALSCKVTALPVLDDTLPALFEQMGNEVECELRAEPPGAQQELPLNQHGNGEQPAEKPKPKRGRPRKGDGVRAH